jgi:DNA-binding transcriptional ArsR family regulator
LKDLKVNSERLSLEWVSAAEAPRFVKLITEFTERIRKLGPLGSSENLDPGDLMVKLRAAKMALEGKRLRMVFARQAKYMKHEGAYREIPSDHKLHADMDKALKSEMAKNGLLLYLKDSPREAEELAGLLGVSSDDVVAHFKKLEKKGLVEPDRLIGA